jgi:hypothetical protein
MQAPNFYRAARGRRHWFLSVRDADAYDRGHANFPQRPQVPEGSPEWAGYSDAKAGE